MEDREIVDLYWRRSDLAISETDKKYGRYCRTIAMNICGSEHKRFINECKAAKAAGCSLVILVENTLGITDISQVHKWINPRVVYSSKCVQGPRLQKAMETISERYGVRFMFCRPEDAGRIITEILDGKLLRSGD